MELQNQHTADIICGTTGTAGGAACLAFLEIMPFLIQLLSLVSISLSIAWFIYRFYKAWIE
jgi:hypothetical protein